MEGIFDEIYRTNAWNDGSGQGSVMKHVRGYARFLERFVRERGVRSVVDMGCGDWQFSRTIDWGGAGYHGFDVVASVIEQNRREHAREGVAFSHYSGDPAELPAADLLIVKDVLQHLSNERVHALLPHVSRYRWALLTNCVDPWGETVNGDTEDGGFRYLDLRRAPFHLDAEEVYVFSKRMFPLRRLVQRPRWRKRVLLAENAGAALS